MGLKVGEATTDDERARLYAFRYRVYVEEMKIDTPEADHERKWLRDALDAQSRLHVLLDGEDVVGTLRTTILSEVEDRSYLENKFHIEPALEKFSPNEICATGRFMLDPKLRHGTAILRLMKSGFEQAHRHGIRLNYGDCSPHLLPFYEHLGFRRYERAFNDTSYGFKVPILMLLGDRERLERVRSPLARIGKDAPTDVEAHDWFEKTYPEAASLESAQLLPEGVFLELLRQRIATDPLHSEGLLHGLDEDEASRFLARATVVEAQPGDLIVRQGELGDTLFVVMKGVCEVQREETPDRALSFLGSGDPFGEIGFLTESLRTANVVARTPCDIVVLSAEFLRAFLNREPTVAAKVLLNLSRVLASRLSETSAR